MTEKFDRLKVVPDDSLHPNPDDMSNEVAAFADRLTVALDEAAQSLTDEEFLFVLGIAYGMFAAHRLKLRH